jgi:hypothetical protein
MVICSSPRLLVPLYLQSIEGLTAEVEDMRRQRSPLAAAQAAKQEVLADQRKFQEVIAGNQVCGYYLPYAVLSSSARMQLAAAAFAVRREHH